jgi:hypothetical protein
MYLIETEIDHSQRKKSLLNNPLKIIIYIFELSALHVITPSIDVATVSKLFNVRFWTGNDE